MSKLYNKEDSKFTIAMFDRGIEIGKKQMIEWLEKEFAKHDGIIVNAFKKEIMKKAKKQAGEEK